MPGCLDMPYQVTHNNGYQFREYGIHNGARCKLKSVQLDEKDAIALEGALDPEVVLQAMPIKLYVEMEAPMKKHIIQGCQPIGSR